MRAERIHRILQPGKVLSRVAGPAGGRQMSLRDAWTRYLSVGGPLSGLEMPFIGEPPRPGPARPRRESPPTPPPGALCAGVRPEPARNPPPFPASLRLLRDGRQTYLRAPERAEERRGVRRGRPQSTPAHAPGPPRLRLRARLGAPRRALGPATADPEARTPWRGVVGGEGGGSFRRQGPRPNGGRRPALLRAGLPRDGPASPRGAAGPGWVPCPSN